MTRRTAGLQRVSTEAKAAELHTKDLQAAQCLKQVETEKSKSSICCIA